MGYRVIHLIEAAYWINDLEYSQLVEQCEQIYSGLTEDENCSRQICLTMSDVVREIPSEDGWWPGESAFVRPRYTYVPEAKICFEDALNTAAEFMQEGLNWAIILYTAGGIRRPKRTMLHKWKKYLWNRLLLLAVKNVHADPKFLESYTEECNVFSVGMSYDVIQVLKNYGKMNQSRELFHEMIMRTETEQQFVNGLGLTLEEWEEVWEIVRKSCGTLL